MEAVDATTPIALALKQSIPNLMSAPKVGSKKEAFDAYKDYLRAVQDAQNTHTRAVRDAQQEYQRNMKDAERYMQHEKMNSMSSVLAGGLHGFSSFVYKMQDSKNDQAEYQRQVEEARRRYDENIEHGNRNLNDAVEYANRNYEDRLRYAEDS